MSIYCGILSDTHVPTRASHIPDRVFSVFEDHDVKYIFHAGDFVEVSVLTSLQRLNAEVIACRGNMDSYSICKKLPNLAEVRVLHHEIAVIHDLRNFPMAHSKHDIIISGHTHVARIEERGSQLLINPGSPTNTWRDQRTVALLQLTDQERTARIVKI
ncbi:MAG: metallophosphoesterase family protein [Candidatus Helarchaeota archaeon]